MIALTKLVHIGIFSGVVFLMPLLAESATSKPTVWVVFGMERVAQKDEPQQRRRIELFAARGEDEPFQIAVHSTGKPLSNVNLTFSDLHGPKGSVIGKDNLVAYREHYVHVAHGSPE